MFKKTALLFSSILMTACAGQQALPPSYNGPVATIQESSVRVDRGKAQMFYLNYIDGNYILDNIASKSFSASIGQGNNLTIITEPYLIPAEKRTYTVTGSHIWAMDGRGILEADLSVSGDITFTPVEGRTYLINGTLSQEESVVWIKDIDSGEVVAEFRKGNP